MDAQENQLLDRYRPHFGGLSLSDEEMLRVIQAIMSISSNIVDLVFQEVLGDGEASKKSK